MFELLKVMRISEIPYIKNEIRGRIFFKAKILIIKLIILLSVAFFFEDTIWPVICINHYHLKADHYVSLVFTVTFVLSSDWLLVGITYYWYHVFSVLIGYWYEVFSILIGYWHHVYSVLIG